jgi:hypothetical protein
VNGSTCASVFMFATSDFHFIRTFFHVILSNRTVPKLDPTQKSERNRRRIGSSFELCILMVSGFFFFCFKVCDLSFRMTYTDTIWFCCRVDMKQNLEFMFQYLFQTRQNLELTYSSALVIRRDRIQNPRTRTAAKKVGAWGVTAPHSGQRNTKRNS